MFLLKHELLTSVSSSFFHLLVSLGFLELFQQIQATFFQSLDQGKGLNTFVSELGCHRERDRLRQRENVTDGVSDDDVVCAAEKTIAFLNVSVRCISALSALLSFPFCAKEIGQK